jgi:hypothetical protein
VVRQPSPAHLIDISRPSAKQLERLKQFYPPPEPKPQPERPERWERFGWATFWGGAKVGLISFALQPLGYLLGLVGAPEALVWAPTRVLLLALVLMFVAWSVCLTRYSLGGLMLYTAMLGAWLGLYMHGDTSYCWLGFMGLLFHSTFGAMFLAAAGNLSRMYADEAPVPFQKP